MEVPCKVGKLIISDRSVQVVKPFGKVAWSVMRSAVVGVSLKNGALSCSVTFQTAAGPFTADMVTKSKAQEIVQMFM